MLKADLVVRKIVLDVGTRLVERSPVGDPTYWKSEPPAGYVGGRFRANWQYGDSVMPGGTLKDVDPSGASTIGKLTGKVEIHASGKLHYLVNNLPYAHRLENGWSRQAPFGMVNLTFIEFKPIVRAASRALSL